MGRLLLYRAPSDNARRSATAQQLLQQSRTLLTSARECVSRHREKRDGLAKRCTTTRDIVESSHEQLRLSAQALFDAWELNNPRPGVARMNDHPTRR
jgi:hypothetical protein